MKIEDHWQEGEVVERQEARRVYEDFLHQRQDPALLEHAAGNSFSTRVFPIPARGIKELVISYTEERSSGSSPFRLPLGGLPRVDRAEAEVFDAQGTLLGAFHQEGAQPDGDFTVELGAREARPGLRSASQAIARIKVELPQQEEAPAPTLILVDTSASRAVGFEAQLALLEGLVRRAVQKYGASIHLGVLAFDQEQELVHDGPAGEFGAAALGRLRERGALGASSLGAALREAGRLARGRGWKRVWVVSDGVATAEEDDSEALGKLAASLGGAGIERIDAIAVGGIREDRHLKSLVRAGLPRAGAVLDGALGEERVWSGLARATQRQLPVHVEGASWWSPRVLEGAQHGDEVLVAAELQAPSHELQISVGQRSSRVPLDEAPAPLLGRAVAIRKIDDLLTSKQSRETREQVIALSTRHRVVTPFTALLTLETERDYERFHLDRRALADVMTIRGGKLLVDGRRAAPEAPSLPPVVAEDLPSPVASSPGVRPASPVLVPPPAPAAPVASGPPVAPEPAPIAATRDAEVPTAQTRDGDPPGAVGNMWGRALGDPENTSPVGGLGLGGVGYSVGDLGGIGHGGGSFGASSSAVRQALPARVRMGAATVQGRIPPEVIRRIVLQNSPRLRICYEQGLRQQPTLRGRIAVRFVIGKDGSVAAAAVGQSDLPPAVSACVVNVFRTLHFPQVDGLITVVYPLQFGDGGPPGPWVNADNSRGKPAPATPYSGEFASVKLALAEDPKLGLARALRWRSRSPGDVLALLALGEAHERLHDTRAAARAYGSIIDLFPARADLRRHAAARMEALGKEPLDLVIDDLRKAREQRPDHPSSHRMLAMALLRAGRAEEAFRVLEEGLKRPYPLGRFQGYKRILGEDLGLAAAVWKRAEPGRQEEIERRLKGAGGVAEEGPSLRFVLTWETDANDVDFHIYDGEGNRAFYGHRALRSGGELYDDVTNGYGPECFTVRKPRAARSIYTLQARYYARGPMGYGMGKLEVIEHDGQGQLTLEGRPFVIQEDRAYVDLGSVNRGL
jgi:tetratricopeptide (TPR) repeat protein